MIGVWNVRGASRKAFPRAIADLRNLYHFEILAILEPRVSGSRAMHIVKKLGFSNNFIVDAEGDFNEIISSSEKRGGSCKFSNNGFANWIDRNKLVDLGFIGSKFTWMTKRGIGEEIWERLDRALCSMDWRLCYPEVLEENLLKEYNDILEQEDFFWQQKCRNCWLKEGDKSTKFFHLSTIIRRRRNKLEGLKKEDGSWAGNTEDIKNTVVLYFQNLFERKESIRSYSHLPMMFPLLTEFDKLSLNASICEQEVKQSLFHICGLKAPGPDGFHALFFQKYWKNCKRVLVRLVSDCFINGVIPDNINHTFISLVPKIPNPICMSQLRPTSLCNTFYKVISKASIQQAQIMRECLDIFCDLLGQQVSFPKSRFFCSSNTTNSCAKKLVDICGSPLTKNSGKYLGVPLIHSRITKDTYKDILEKAQNRMASWKCASLSFVGRCTLIKVVSSALPIYAMQSTQLPSEVCSKLDKLNNNFLWGHTAKIKKIHLINWDTVCLPKCKGGLGIKKTKLMNQTLLAKAGWRLHQNEKGLWGGILMDKYAIKSSLMDCDSKTTRMVGWLCFELWGILEGLKIIWKAGFKKVIIESDSQAAVDLLSNNSSMNHPLFSIIQACKALINNEWSCNIQHVYRESNRVVDCLAKLGHSLELGFSVFKDPPPQVAVVLDDDYKCLVIARLVPSC
ncbi:hypothetical protein Ddye_001432 [Dipteronia dyeriana]|uniref:RNase H type-1 domain-containing protein n=1 Tax=Dipteronia dyeriana TaxID=168575 RepID=A0AAD9XPV9_9ROSI|nr:hypothetical protein Ddye_001432 [Dipteronia dyeriana]